MTCFSRGILFLLSLSLRFIHSFAFGACNLETAVSIRKCIRLHALVDKDSNEVKIHDDEIRIQTLKQSLMELSKQTKRGFFASSSQRANAKKIIEQLASLNPTSEPASAYYKGDIIAKDDDIAAKPTIAGKWTLLYTNAPDITSLDPNTSLLPVSLPPSAKLGRIGQECDAVKSTISNVIEWTRPDWLSNILFLNQDNNDNTDERINDRILQKVICAASASPSEPNIVKLDLVGFELVGETGSNDSGDNKKGDGSMSKVNTNSLKDLIIKGPAELLKNNPVQLKGPLKAPFGRFEILFLDEQMRIIKTGQGYLAVNIREEEMWF